jgi:EAL domain-containing protein (putative c-di-GMP-specific phosphodiesterase class I)/CheY-like chemotaxis protein
MHSEKQLIFILDDEPAVRQLVRACLDGETFDVMEFADVASVASTLETRTPDLIFLDLELGTGDAIEAFRAMAEKGYQGTIQLMSGRGEGVLDSVKAVGERYGFRFLPPLAKPFRLSQIRRAVEELGAITSASESTAPAVQLSVPPVGASFTLDEALDQGWLELWYQPKVDLRTGATVGAEGLIRARHPEHGIVGPYAFLARASDEALARLTEFVLLSALQDWDEFHQIGHPLLLSVNAPVSALLTMPIAQLVRQSRSKDQSWPGLVLEVTEDQILENIPFAQEIAAQLQIYDIALSLDDFGQGYSSLARLRDLPFSSLKIDRAFVDGCALDPVKADLCRTIVEMAHRFGCEVVAEGIETEADLEVIKATGCDYGQGYLLGRPMPKSHLIQRMDTGSKKAE